VRRFETTIAKLRAKRDSLIGKRDHILATLGE